MTTVYGFSIAMKLLTLKLTVAVKLDVAGIDWCIIANLWKFLTSFDAINFGMMWFLHPKSKQKIINYPTH